MLKFFCLLLMPTTLGISWSRNCFFLLICPFVLHITHSCLPNVKFVYCMYGQYNKTFLLSSISYYNPLNTGQTCRSHWVHSGHYTTSKLGPQFGLPTTTQPEGQYDIHLLKFGLGNFFIGHVNIYNKCREYTHLIT